MILYNITVNIDRSVRDKWLHWVQTKYIPKILATKKITSVKIFRVLIEEEMGGTTYSVQLFADSKSTLEKYYQEDAPAFKQEAMQLFGDKMLTFTTELELISEY